MSMVETLVKPGSGPTYHSHAREDETFYVVSGTVEAGSTGRFSGAKLATGFSVHATCFIPIVTSGILI
jgi:uncharacterized cupin superfamily protein